MYPVGIPVLYAAVLWNIRELLNPRIHIGVRVEAGETGQDATTNGFLEGLGILRLFSNYLPMDQSENELSQQELQQFNETVRARKDHPELIPSMFLWKDFGEGSSRIQSPVSRIC